LDHSLLPVFVLIAAPDNCVKHTPACTSTTTQGQTQKHTSAAATMHSSVYSSHQRVHHQRPQQQSNLQNPGLVKQVHRGHVRRSQPQPQQLQQAEPQQQQESQPQQLQPQQQEGGSIRVFVWLLVALQFGFGLLQ
jgi:hypothetical protein